MIHRMAVSAAVRFRSVTLIYSPYHCGLPGVAVGNGPTYLQQRNVKGAVESCGVDIKDSVTIQPVHQTFEGDIARSFEVFRRLAASVAEAHGKESFPIILAGNCGSSIGTAAGSSDLLKRLGEKLACVWFDAHDDFNTPDTLVSGYFDSMPVAMLAGLCFKPMLNTIPGNTPLRLERLIHVGMRDVNDLERQHVQDAGMSIVWGGDGKQDSFASGLQSFIQQKDLAGQPTQVHFDVDSLDTSIGKANRFAAPGGLLEADAMNCFSEIVTKTHPISFTIASFDPSFEGAERIADVAIRGLVHFLNAMKGKGLIDGRGSSAGL